MSFSMKDVTALTKRRKGIIKVIFGAINTDIRLTEPVAMALHIYVDHILKTTGISKINVEIFKSDLNKLLSYHCKKNAILITRDDVEQCENYIISDIKRAISAGGLYKLKYDDTGSDELEHIAEVLLKREIEKNNSTRLSDSQKSNFGSKMTKEDMERFLTELEVI